MKISGENVAYNSKEFKSLFEMLFPIMCLFASRILQDKEKGKDIAQEAFVKLCQKDNQDFEDNNALKAYLYVLVKNACISLIRKEKNLKSTSLEDVKHLPEQEFLNEVLREETYQLLRNAIQDLSPQATLVVKLALKGYRNLDIADELGVSINTVKTVKKRAYKTLRKNIGNQFVTILLTNFIPFF
tara:strand:- start:30486 stop:31043 length:558 start_codon:yes stop_codon:yes gene_type:complete